MKSLRTSFFIASCFCSGCGIATAEDVDALSAQLATAQTRIDQLEGALESQSTQLERLEARSTQLERAVSRRRPPANEGVGGPIVGLDPDQQRRLNAVGVDLLEKMAKSGQAEETIESLGALTNAYLRQATREVESEP